MMTSQSSQQYEQMTQTLTQYVRQCYDKLESLGIAVGSAFKQSDSAGKSKMNEYNEAMDQWLAAKAALYYHENYTKILQTKVLIYGMVDRLNSEWHDVYKKIKQDLSDKTREKIAAEKRVFNQVINGGSVSNSDVEKLNEYDEMVRCIKCCKVFHEKLYNVAFNYNSQVTKHHIGEILNTTDKAGNSYLGAEIKSIVGYDVAASTAAETPLDSLLSSMPPPYNELDTKFTRFYVAEYLEPQEAPPPVENEDGTMSQEPPPPPISHVYVLWDKILNK